VLGGFGTSRAVFLPNVIRKIIDFRPRSTVHRLDLIVLLTFEWLLFAILILTRPRTAARFQLMRTHDSPPFLCRSVQTVMTRLEGSKNRAGNVVPDLIRAGRNRWRSPCSVPGRAHFTPEEGSLKRLVALALIALGVMALAYGNISFTREKKIVDLGPVEVTKDKREAIPLSPVAGGVFLAAGIVLLVIRPRD
jgi:hypothetical protein